MKRLFVGAIALASLLAAGNASAFEFGTPEQKAPYRSPQNFAIEFRFGPYTPQIDDEPGLKGTPFKDSFGSGARVYAGLEFDWQLYRIPGIGTIGPAISIGRSSMSRSARTVTGRVSGDTYSLSVYPMYVAAVLRVDTLWRTFGIPFVPYAKAGMAVGLWSADNALGTATYNGVKGSGASFGENIAGGVWLPFDFFDRGSARGMDSQTGINTTAFFFEYYWLNLDGLAQSHALYVGTRSWVAGMLFEF